MKPLSVLAVWGVALSLVLASGASAAPAPLLTTSLTAGTPAQTIFNGNPTIQINYTNTLPSSELVIAYLAVQNSQGQTVKVFVSTANVDSGASVQVYLVMFGLPSGHYTGNVFVVTTDEVPVSQLSTVSISI